MLSALLGRKVGMTQVFGPNGQAIPVTVVEVGPCVVTQVKTAGHDGYEAVQIGFGAKRPKNVTRAELGHLGHKLELTEHQKKSQTRANRAARAAATQTEADQAEGAAPKAAKAKGKKPTSRSHGQALGPFQVLREVKVLGEMPAVGDSITVDMFADGEFVDVIGTSKGKGFAGVMKRHNFRGGPRTHGQSDRARAPGSIGPGTTPGRVLKGTRMAGRMGNERVTVKELEIVTADAERNLLVIKGAIPGANGGVVMIRKGAESLAVAKRAAQPAGK
jgi:large subunit ribosomal protein L3